VEWEVEFTDEFESWWDGLKAEEQEDVRAYVKLLQEHGPDLKFPYSSGVIRSKFDHMRELLYSTKENRIACCTRSTCGG
jgi:hypothetical protein